MASESNPDLARMVSNAMIERCREANVNMVGSSGNVPEELVRSAVETALQSELAQAETRPDVSADASHSAYDAEVALFENRSMAEVSELVKSAVEEAVQCELASQAEASVGGDGHSAAVDADVALLAHRSVQEVLSAVAQRSEAEQPPAVPEQPAEVQPSQPVAPAQPELPVTLEQPVAPEQPVQ
ncbi:unnamed protein product, partial [Durusdinium trenchii]